MKRQRVGILVFPDVEVLDFCGPFEVFSVARLNEQNRAEELSPFEVVLVASNRDIIRTTGGMRVQPDHDLASCPRLDILVVPGGRGTRREVDNERLVNWIRSQAVNLELLTSVCTGSFLLGQAGLIDNRRATTHWSSLERLRTTFPAVRVEDHLHVVEDGNIITSAGISAGIDMALRIVARIHGEEVARATARYMEYSYSTSNERRI